ncbi:MAG: 6,7-dimethyl-8-ribityllumazine synthase [Flavobacteriaceae bacterium]|nr:6,7-dimethyl-8-ribityllumazine synthase [Flavobacteriaceae bacterium]
MSSLQSNLSEYDSSLVPNGKGLRVALVVSQWNSEITEQLCEGALTTLIDHDVYKSDIIRYNVPGSFELVYGSKFAQDKNFNIVIAIGSVIKGETKHFDFICQGVVNGIAELNSKGRCPVIFCVLTDNDIHQARDRSGGKHGNKGVEAAISALKMAKLA